MNDATISFKTNFRDLGGIKTADGKFIKPNILLRSAHLSNINKKDIELLKEKYNLKKVVDLRSAAEKEKHPNIILDDVEYIDIPYFNEETMALTSGMGSDVLSAIKKAQSREELLGYIPDLTKVYPLIITNEYSLTQLSECIRLIINNREGAVLFHCTAGKDRTGVTAAIILSILGVRYPDILVDYMKTNRVSMKNADKYSKMASLVFRDKRLAEKTKTVFSADKAFLDSVFDAINEKFGSFEKFVSDGLKISDDEIISFKNYALINGI